MLLVLVLGYDAVGKGSALALHGLVRSIPFFFSDALHHGRYGPEGLTLRALVVIPGSGMCKAGFTGYSAPRAVFLVLLSSGPGARHLGRYGPD